MPDESDAIPPPCDREVFQRGTLVMVTHTIRSRDMEEWVKKVAALSDQRVDWHFAGGRACILALGDLSRVRSAINDLLPEHNELQRREVEQMWANIGEPVPRGFAPSCTLYGDNEWNPVYETHVRPQEAQTVPQ